MAVENDVYSFLVSQGTSTVGLFCGPAKPAGVGIPDQATFILQTGGGAPNGFMDGRGTDYRPIRVQVLVRAPLNSYSAGRDAAQALWELLQRGQLSSASGYITCTCEQAAPMYIGRDDQDHHRWTVNVRVGQEI